MRSEDFSFGFAEDVGKFVYLGETFEISGISTSCAELAWMFKEQKQSWNLLEPRSFVAYKNVAVLMIAMLGHSEVDTEVSDTDIKIMRSNNCREISEDARNANGVLVTTWERARFFLQKWTEFYQHIYLVNH